MCLEKCLGVVMHGRSLPGVFREDSIPHNPSLQKKVFITVVILEKDNSIGYH